MHGPLLLLLLDHRGDVREQLLRVADDAVRQDESHLEVKDTTGKIRSMAVND